MADLGDIEGQATARRPGTAGTIGRQSVRNSPLLEEAWRYWTSQRDGGAMPRRATMDPNAMGPILGHSMILDRVRPGTVRIRLGGHVLNRMMGMEVRGLPVRAFFDIADRTRVMRHIEMMFEAPATLEFYMISDGPGGIVTARMVILPLLDSSGDVTKALAVLVTDRDIVGPPRRFQLTHATAVPITGAAAGATPEGPRRRISDRHLPVEIQAGMAESPAAFEGRALRRTVAPGGQMTAAARR